MTVDRENTNPTTVTKRVPMPGFPLRPSRAERHRTRRHRYSDAGYSIPEMLVAGVLAVAVGALVLANIMKADNSGADIAGRTWNQSALNDAATRITRDVATANPILFTRKADGTGWPADSPSRTDVWTQHDTGVGAAANCVRVRYYVDPGKTAKTWALKSDTYKYATGCPDPRKMATSGATKHTATLIEDLTTGDPDATHNPNTAPSVFDYVNRANTSLLGGGNVINSRAAVASIARVKVSLGTNAPGMAKGLRLQTSVSPRTVEDPDVTSIPLPDCVQANLRVANDNRMPTAPVVSWNRTENADTFTLTRTISGNNATYSAHLPATAVLNDSTARTSDKTFTDEDLRGYHDIKIAYSLTISGPGGVVTCSPAGVFTVETPPDSRVWATPPTLSATVTPGGLTMGHTNNTPVSLTWSKPDHATSYTLRLKTKNGSGNWVDSETASTESNSKSWPIGLDKNVAWTIQARSSDWTPAITSVESAPVEVQAHAAAPTITSEWIGSGGTYGIIWEPKAGSTASAWNIYYSKDNGGTWTKETTLAKAARSHESKVCSNSSLRCKYAIAAVNTGKRGTTSPNATWEGNNTRATVDAKKFQRQVRETKYEAFTPLYAVQEFHYSKLDDTNCFFPPGQDRTWVSGQTVHWVPLGINKKRTEGRIADCGEGSGAAEYRNEAYYIPWADRNKSKANNGCGASNTSASVQKCYIGGQDRNYTQSSYNLPSAHPDWNQNNDKQPGTLTALAWGEDGMPWDTGADSTGGRYWSDVQSTTRSCYSGFYGQDPTEGLDIELNTVPNVSWLNKNPPQAYDKAIDCRWTNENHYEWYTEMPAGETTNPSTLRRHKWQPAS